MQKRILLVDDESSIRKTISLGLTQEGIDVEPCENGMDALKKLEIYKHNNIDLSTIVLDIKLPDIDGIKLGKIIRAKYPEISLIYITGYADKYNVHEINSLNVSALIEKPFTSTDLYNHINEIYKAQISAYKDIPVSEAESKSVSVYALIKIKKDVDFFEAYRQLYFSSNAVYCDTTKGEYDIILLLQAENAEKIEALSKELISENDFIDDVTFLNVKKPIVEESINDFIHIAETLDPNEVTNRNFSKKVCSYILLDIEKEKFAEIYPVLKLDDQVLFCDYTAGKYNLILFVQGNYYTQIDNFIENKLSNLEGILKIKEFPVVNMFDM